MTRLWVGAILCADLLAIGCGDDTRKIEHLKAQLDECKQSQKEKVSELEKRIAAVESMHKVEAERAAAEAAAAEAAAKAQAAAIEAELLKATLEEKLNKKGTGK